MTTATIDKTATTLPVWTIDAAAFRALIDAVSPAARKGFLGVPMIRLATGDDGLLVAQADDLNHGIEAWVEADVLLPGEVVASHDVLSALLARVDGLLECAATAKGLTIRTEGTDATVRTLPSDHQRYFPPITPSDEGGMVNASDLARAIDRVAHAAKKEDHGRPVLTGVHLAVRDESLLALATDGYRAAMCAIGDSPADWPGRGYTVPATTTNALHRLLVKLPAGDTVRIAQTVSGGRLVVTAESWRWSSVLIDGVFPDVPRIIESVEGSATTALVATQSLDKAVALALAFSPATPGDDKKSHKITLRLGEGDIVTVSAAGPDLGSVDRDVPAHVDGPPITVMLDARYLRDALAACPGTVEMRVAAPNVTVVLADPAGPDRFAISPLVGG